MPMIRRSVIWIGLIVVWCCAFGATSSAAAATLTLKQTNGETIEGEHVSSNPQGIVVKKADGSFAPRVAWASLTQESLKQLLTIKAAKPFVENLIDPEDTDPTGKDKKAEVEFKVKIPDRLDRPEANAGIKALTSSSITLSFLILLYLGNIYAGYEAGIFRNYPWILTSATAVVLPVIGPVLFICLPTRMKKSQDQLAAESMAAHLAAQQAQE